MCMHISPASLCMYRVCLMPRKAQQALDPQELEFQAMSLFFGHWELK